VPALYSPTLLAQAIRPERDQRSSRAGLERVRVIESPTGVTNLDYRPRR